VGDIAFVGDRDQIPLAAKYNRQDNTQLNAVRMMALRGANNVTFEGVGPDALIYGWGFQLHTSFNVVVRNLHFDMFFEDAASVHGGISTAAAPDITGSTHTWIDHNVFYYGQDSRHLPGRDQDHNKGDGATDFTNRTSHFTVSYNHYSHSGKSMLLGNNLTDFIGFGTVHHNWFDETDQRTPRVRNGSVHVFNNIYEDVKGYGIAAGHLSDIIAEGNTFIAGRRPFMISGQGSAMSGGSNALSQDFPGAIITSTVDNASFWVLGRTLVPNSFSVATYVLGEDVGAINVNHMGAYTFESFDPTSTLSSIGVQPVGIADARVRNEAGTMRW